MRRLGVVIGFLLTAYACGGAVEGGSGGSGASSGFGGFGGVGGSLGGTGGTVKDAGPDVKDAGKDAAKDASGGTGGFVDPGCPDAAPPPPVFECDAFAEPSGCLFGEACYPWVDYPSGPCDFEEFGTICAPAGTGTQGDPCEGLCAPGHVCVITGQGTQCVQLCKLIGPHGCPPGLFCVPIDVEGFGGCF